MEASALDQPVPSMVTLVQRMQIALPISIWYAANRPQAVSALMLLIKCVPELSYARPLRSASLTKKKTRRNAKPQIPRSTEQLVRRARPMNARINLLALTYLLLMISGVALPREKFVKRRIYCVRRV